MSLGRSSPILVHNPGKVVILCCFLLAFFVSASLHGELSPAAQGEEDLAPDLDLLVERAAQFWAFLQKGSKVEALEYVDPATRNTFLKREEIPLLSFQVSDIHLGEDSARVQVTVEAEVHDPRLVRPITVPITESYVFREGTWFVQIAGSKVRELFDSSNKPEAKTLTDEERALLENELSRFTFTVEKLAWGEVEQGQGLSLEMPYHNGSSGSVEVDIVDGPAWISLTRSNFGVRQGDTGVIEVWVRTDKLGGAVSGSIQVLLKRESVEDRRDIPIEGYVKTLVTLTPAGLVLDASGFQDIAIRNDTEQDFTNLDFIPPGDFLEVHWIGDRTLEAGATKMLQVRWTIGQIPGDWTSGEIEVRLYEPSYYGRRHVFIQASREQP